MKLRIGPELQRQLAIVKALGEAGETGSLRSGDGNHLRRHRRHGRAARRHGCRHGPAAAGLVFLELAGAAAAVPVRPRQTDRGEGLHDRRRGVTNHR